MILSIITISYKNIQGLKRTAESVINQTFTEYEWIVIDGNSQDGTKEYLEQLVPQPTYWISEPDKGIYDAMNKGLKKATGDWCIFMNSGDSFYNPNVLECVFSKFPEQGDIVYCDAMYRLPDNDLHMQYPDKLDIMFFYSRCICHQATFIKTQLLRESNGYSTEYKIVSDWRAWVIWIMQNRHFVHLPVIVCNFMLDGIGSTNLEEAKLERDRVFKEVMPVYAQELMQSIDIDYTARLEYHIRKLHEQFDNKAVIRTSLIIRRKNWFVRRITRSFIHLISVIDKYLYKKNYTDNLSDFQYDAEHPSYFEFK